VLDEEYFSHACFLAQQRIEKALKGYLIQQTGSSPKTHRLADLLADCMAVEATFSQFLPDCTIVDQYYTPTRYPDAVAGSGPYDLPGHTEADEAIQVASSLFGFVQARL
jgi:HEPN domain-containing protein